MNSTYMRKRQTDWHTWTGNAINKTINKRTKYQYHATPGCKGLYYKLFVLAKETHIQQPYKRTNKPRYTDSTYEILLIYSIGEDNSVVITRVRVVAKQDLGDFLLVYEDIVFSLSQSSHSSDDKPGRPDETFYKVLVVGSFKVHTVVILARKITQTKLVSLSTKT